jgi:hypothetical protein
VEDFDFGTRLADVRFQAADLHECPCEQPLVAEGVEELGADRFCATIVPVG